MKFNPSDYGHKTVMHCNTEWKAIVFCNFLRELDMRWCNGDVYLDTEWDHYCDNMCYSFHFGKYGNMGFYKTYNYTILEFDDFEWDSCTLEPKPEEKPIKLRFTW